MLLADPWARRPGVIVLSVNYPGNLAGNGVSNAKRADFAARKQIGREGGANAGTCSAITGLPAMSRAGDSKTRQQNRKIGQGNHAVAVHISLIFEIHIPGRAAERGK